MECEFLSTGHNFHQQHITIPIKLFLWVSIVFFRTLSLSLSLLPASEFNSFLPAPIWINWLLAFHVESHSQLIDINQTIRRFVHTENVQSQFECENLPLNGTRSIRSGGGRAFVNAWHDENMINWVDRDSTLFLSHFPLAFFCSFLSSTTKYGRSQWIRKYAENKWRKKLLRRKWSESQCVD